MTELLDVVHAFPDPLKAGWALWLVWGGGQLLWFRRGRTAALPALPPPRPRPRRVVKPPAPPEQEPPHDPPPIPVAES